MTSASTISFSNTLLEPSLSEVVTRVCPWSSSHLRIPSSFSVVPRRRGSCLACSLPCSKLSVPCCKLYEAICDRLGTYIVQAKKNLALSRGRGCQCSDRTNLREGTGRRGALRKQRAGGAGEVDGGACKYHCECMRGEVWIGREEECEAGGGGYVGLIERLPRQPVIRG